MRISYSEFTSPGLIRENNQDSIFSAVNDGCGIFVIADGMGGHFGGEIASSRLTEAMKKWWDGFTADKCSFDECREQLKALVTDVNKSLFSEYSSQGKICGTTAAVLFIFDDKYLMINVGDSRIYHFCNGKISQESVDHVFGIEAKIAGTLTDAEIESHKNKNKLTSAIGCKEQFKMNIKTAPLTDSTFFICTDGVYKYSADKLINMALKEGNHDKLTQNVRKAVEGNGAGDNYSFIRIDAGDPTVGTGFFINSAFDKKNLLSFCVGAAAAILIIVIMNAVNNTGNDIPALGASSALGSMPSESTALESGTDEEMACGTDTFPEFE